jgi:neutral ceramidase
MAGYGSRVKPFAGVYDELYAMALMLDDGKKKVLIITFDVCMIDRTFSSGIKKLVKEKYGLNPEDIIVHAVHTHAGPVSFLPRTTQGISDYDDIVRFRKLLEEKIMICVDNCMASPKEGSMEIGTGETYIGMNRRQKKPDGVVIGPNPDQEIDRLAQAVTIKNTAGDVELVLFSCSCHPVVLYPRNMNISVDFPGAARTELEKKFPGASAMFVQGSCGDINPNVLVADDEYRDTYYSDVLFTGRILANDIYNIIKKGMKRIDLSIETVAGRIVLPLDGEPLREETPEDSDIVQGEIQASVIKLSDDFRIVGLDGEICNQVGVHIRELFDEGQTMVLGYVDGWVGYIPTAKILEEGGYESRCTVFIKPYAMDLENVLLTGLKELIKRM